MLRRIWRNSQSRLLVRLLGDRRTWTAYAGRYRSWEDALRDSSGYDSAIILNRVLEATRRVAATPGLWERDSVVFDSNEVNQPVLDCLLAVAASAGGRLCVLDFGGSLGSVWWQHRPHLAHLNRIRWCVVEQPAFAEVGRREFQTEELLFFDTVQSCIAQESPNVILLSSVLPYVKTPYELIDALSETECENMIVDRTGFTPGDKDLLTVQYVPSNIYRASYPCWFLSEARFRSKMREVWDVRKRWDNCDSVSHPLYYQGLFLQRVGRSIGALDQAEGLR